MTITTIAEWPLQRDAVSRHVPATRVVVGEPSRWPALGLVAVSVGLAAVALLGPLVFELIDYRVSETLRNQTIGLDAVSLLFVAPLALIAAVLVLRRHIAGPALALGIGAYTSYMFVQYILGPDYANRGGNNERLFRWRSSCSRSAGAWLLPLGTRSTSSDCRVQTNAS